MGNVIGGTLNEIYVVAQKPDWARAHDEFLTWLSDLRFRINADYDEAYSSMYGGGGYGGGYYGGGGGSGGSGSRGGGLKPDNKAPKEIPPILPVISTIVSGIIEITQSQLINNSINTFRNLQAEADLLGLRLDYSSQLLKLDKMGAFTKWTGIGANTLGIFCSFYQFSNATTLEGRIEYGFDMIMGGMGFIPGAGPVISVYWGTVGKPLHYEWVRNTLTFQIDMGIAGYPSVMPFK